MKYLLMQLQTFIKKLIGRNDDDFDNPYAVF